MHFICVSPCDTSPVPKGKIKYGGISKMKKEVSQNEFRKYYLSEFELYDGEAFITFNIVSINTKKRESTFYK